MNEASLCTPRYVLLDGNHRIGPKVISSDLGAGCSVIYGFTDKGCYDRFRRNGDPALRPYPLVERYLRTEADSSGGELKLVVIDADGPCERSLHAATMEAVLHAQESAADRLYMSHRLMFDEEVGAYSVEESLASFTEPIRAHEAE